MKQQEYTPPEPDTYGQSKVSSTYRDRIWASSLSQLLSELRHLENTRDFAASEARAKKLFVWDRVEFLLSFHTERAKGLRKRAKAYSN